MENFCTAFLVDVSAIFFFEWLDDSTLLRAIFAITALFFHWALVLLGHDDEN
jgi:hypothetical protein